MISKIKNVTCSSFRISILISILLSLGCSVNNQKKANKEKGKLHYSNAFAWPFQNVSEMQPRGGFTKGSEVTINSKPSTNWLSLQKKGLSNYEKDRFAILAMSGDYRTSFQFIETGGFTDNYTPPRPYFSWGTEHIKVLEDSENLISLQHILVMFMKQDDGKIDGPFVMKHWRQDWSFEKTNLHEYKGNSTWEQRKLTKDEAKGKWVQSVFQVDDSPRYEVVGEWSHGNQYSSWKSQKCLRPLPRREFSVRDDYNVLEGNHRITITQNGWLHEQHNRKVKRAEKNDEYIAQETGFSRYESITSPDLSNADMHWKKVKEYWKTVRHTWKNILSSKRKFYVKPELEGNKLWQIHFKNIQLIEDSEIYEKDHWASQIHETIHQFVEETGSKMENEKAY